jgi:hypothetical protein
MATTHQTWDPAAITSVLTTELNSLGIGGFSALGSAYDNSTNLFLYALFQLDVTYASAPTVDTTVDLFIVPAPDGTHYNYGSSSDASQNFGMCSFNLVASTSQQLISCWGIPLPPTLFKVQVWNNTNRAMPASGNTVKMIPYGLKAA